MKRLKQRLLATFLAFAMVLSFTATSVTAADSPTAATAVSEGLGFTVSDALAILRHVVGLERLCGEQIARYDSTGSGDVSVEDALAILRYIVGLETRDEYRALFGMINELHEENLEARRRMQSSGGGWPSAMMPPAADIDWFDNVDAGAPPPEATAPATAPPTEGTTANRNSTQGNAPAPAPSEPSETDETPDFSDTNNQVEGVQESDIVKTDGRHIFVAHTRQNWSGGGVNPMVSVVRAHNGNMDLVTQIEFPTANSIREMLLFDGKLVVIWMSRATPADPVVQTHVHVFDTSGDFTKPSATYFQDGTFHSARMVANHIYLISNFRPTLPNNELAQTRLDDYVPSFTCNGQRRRIRGNRIIMPEQLNAVQYTIIGGLNVSKRNMTVSVVANLGATDTIYMSRDNIYLARSVRRNAEGDLLRTAFHGWRGGWGFANTHMIEYTDISKFTVARGGIDFAASATVRGSVRNQFHFDEHDGYLRVVTEVWGDKPAEDNFDGGGSWQMLPMPAAAADRGWWNDWGGRGRNPDSDWGLQGGMLHTFDADMNLLAEVHRIGFGENVHAVRFMGNLAYIVTFWQTDPLFAFDLSDPANPVLLGELKIPGFSRYLHSWDDGLLLGMGVNTTANGVRSGLRMTMFDVSDNEDLQERHVITIRGGVSPIENDHRAALVSPSRNIIGFPFRNGNVANYAIYSYCPDDGFGLLGEIRAAMGWNRQMAFTRGLFIGNYVYAISENMIVSVRVDESGIYDERSLILVEGPSNNPSSLMPPPRGGWRDNLPVPLPIMPIGIDVPDVPGI
jgi:uncharacterized secreted protein with C-terminal beta-propeller domain